VRASVRSPPPNRRPHVGLRKGKLRFVSRAGVHCPRVDPPGRKRNGPPAVVRRVGTRVGSGDATKGGAGKSRAAAPKVDRVTKATAGTSVRKGKKIGRHSVPKGLGSKGVLPVGAVNQATMRPNRWAPELEKETIEVRFAI
jgi:hypothetical protein